VAQSPRSVPLELGKAMTRGIPDLSSRTLGWAGW